MFQQIQNQKDGWERIGHVWKDIDKATGELLLFTDADTKHAKNVISLSVSHLLSLQSRCIISNPKITYI